jgi:hypothetical protein
MLGPSMGWRFGCQTTDAETSLSPTPTQLLTREFGHYNVGNHSLGLS